MKFKLLVATSFFIPALVMAEVTVKATPSGGESVNYIPSTSVRTGETPSGASYKRTTKAAVGVSTTQVQGANGGSYEKTSTAPGVSTTQVQGANGGSYEKTSTAPGFSDNRDAKYQSGLSECNGTSAGCMEKQAPSAMVIMFTNKPVTIDKTVNGNTAQQTITGSQGNEITASESRTSTSTQTTTDVTITNTKNSATTSAERVSTVTPVYTDIGMMDCNANGSDCVWVETPIQAGSSVQNTVTIQRNSNTISAVGTGATAESPTGTITVNKNGKTVTRALQ